MQENTTWSVVVIDMFDYCDPDHETTVDGFATEAAATEYARRRTRDSLERFRRPEQSPEDLRDRWQSFGEDCLVLNGSYKSTAELDYFIAHPATATECDWVSLTPDPELRQLLLEGREEDALMNRSEP